MKNSIKLEVCVDNIESIISAATVGADRLELCGALSVGGITPSAGLVKYAKINTDISLHAMIRTRAGDFLFNTKEKEAMEYDINSFSDMGVDGVVIGFLDQNFNVDLRAIDRFVKLAKKKNLFVTFHRAIDFAKDYKAAIKSLITLGIDRILTSGKADKAILGLDKITEVNIEFGQRVEIMAGSGVNSKNVCEIISKAGIQNIHCSASRSINKFPSNQLSLGRSASNLSYSIVNIKELKLIKEKISTLQNKPY